MRKLRRLVAHARMKKAGYTGVNDHLHVKGCKSYFSEHWREWA